MRPAYEQYRAGCQMFSLLTNLEVQVFDTDGVPQFRYALYDLPTLLERLKQKSLVHSLQRTIENEKRGMIHRYTHFTPSLRSCCYF